MGAQVTIQQGRIVSPQDDNFIEFKLKMEQNNIPGGQQNEISVYLMIKIKSDGIYKEIQMQNKGLFENCIIFQHNMKIQKNEEYQYYYKVNSEYEKEIRQYKYDSFLEMGVDEWNKIWIGYRFNYQDKKLQQQLNQENFTLVENINIQEGLEIQMKKGQMNENQKLMNEIVIRSNYLMFQFSDDLIYRWLKNSIAKVDKEIYSIIKNNSNKIIEELTKNMNELKKEIPVGQAFIMEDFRTNLELLKLNQLRIIQHFDNEKLYQSKSNAQFKLDENIDQKKLLTKQIQIQYQKFEDYKSIHETYTNNVNTILEELVKDTNEVSDQQIAKLSTPVEIPQIKDPVFENCTQSLINLNNKLKDLQQNKSRIQDEYDLLKIACDQSNQQISDYEKIISKNDDKNQTIIKKLKQELLKKQEEIEKLKEQQVLKLKEQKKYYIIQILETKAKYHKNIQDLQQKEIELIESQKEQKQEMLDQSLYIKLLKIEISKLKNLIRVKDAFIRNQCKYVTNLLQQIQIFKGKSQMKI